jgi:signal transduction histidine kinase
VAGPPAGRPGRARHERSPGAPYDLSFDLPSAPPADLCFDLPSNRSSDEERESRRLAALRGYDVLETPPETAFDRITGLAVRLLEVPVALVSLVDRDRVGVGATEVARDAGVFSSAILQPEPWIIEDAQTDPRACGHPLATGEVGMRFYAGVPLTVPDGHVLGTLCVMDHRPRSLDADQLDLLVDLAAVVVDELELRRQTRLALQFARQADRAAQRERERAGSEAGIARELAELDASRATYLRAVSHDLKTPLSTIRGMAELLANRGEALGERGRSELIMQLGESTEQLQTLVLRLLDRERTRRRDGTVRRQRTDVVGITRNVASQAHLVEAPVAVPEGSLEVNVDPVLFERILDNLLSNAWLHAPSATVIEVELYPGTADGLQLTVSDDGPGIPLPERERVLEAFARAGSERAAPGAGLGLSLVSQFAVMHGGSIDVGEREGGGASFTVELPGASDGRGDPEDLSTGAV